MTVSHELKLCRHVEKKLFVSLVLHEDRYIEFLVFTEEFAGVSMDLGVFLDF